VTQGRVWAISKAVFFQTPRCGDPLPEKRVISRGAVFQTHLPERAGIGLTDGVRESTRSWKEMRIGNASASSGRSRRSAMASASNFMSIWRTGTSAHERRGRASISEAFAAPVRSGATGVCSQRHLGHKGNSVVRVAHATKSANNPVGSPQKGTPSVPALVQPLL
jgi:hypothetical protein